VCKWKKRKKVCASHWVYCCTLKSFFCHFLLHFSELFLRKKNWHKKVFFFSSKSPSKKLGCFGRSNLRNFSFSRFWLLFSNLIFLFFLSWITKKLCELVLRTSTKGSRIKTIHVSWQFAHVFVFSLLKTSIFWFRQSCLLFFC